MALNAPPSLEAEEAMRRVKRTMAGYYDAAEALLAAPLPPPRLMLNAGSDERRFGEDALLRLVAVVENYALSVIVADTEARLEPGSIGERMWGMLPNSFTDTWDGRLKAWQKLFDLKVGGSGSAYEKLGGFIDARNTVAHGLGALTRKQKGELEAIRKRLSQAGLTLNGDRLAIEESNVEACAAAIEAFVVWLDPRRP